MITYAQQQEAIRIRLDQRTDLAAVIFDFSQNRFAYYSKFFFYSSDAQDTTITTVPGQVYYQLPGLMRNCRMIRLNMGSVYLELTRANYNGIYEILSSDVTIPPIQALPSAWAQFGLQFRLYPVADRAYNLELTGNAAPPIPVLDTDDNFWTENTDAGNLIVADTVAHIFKYYLGAPERAVPFEQETKAEVYALLKTTFDLGGPKITRAVGPGWGYNR